MIWMNGTLREAEQAISALDRGLLLGESVFETLLVLDHIPQFWDAHLARLAAAARFYDLPCPYGDDDLREGAQALLAAHKDISARAILRISLTGGAGGRGLVPQNPSPPTLIMQASQAPTPPAALTLADCDVLRFAGTAHNAHKTGAYMDNILARKQALKAGADEAIMKNQHGRIACAAAGNVFIASGDRLLTPPVSEGALPGIMRAALLEQKKIGGLAVEETPLSPALWQAAEAIYITNSVQGICPASYKSGAAQKKQGLLTDKASANNLTAALQEALPVFTDF